MSTNGDEIRWVKPPLQARSQASFSRILDAAEEVITLRGFDGATVADIVKRAKSSVGVFYDRFRDKDALLSTLHERFCEESLATTDAALDPKRWRSATVDQIVSKLVAFLVQIYRQNRGLLKAFMVKCGTDKEFAERGIRLHVYVTTKLAEVLLAHRNELGHPAPDLAVAFGLRMIGSTLDSMVLFHDVDSEPMGLGDDRLAHELTRVFLSYLGCGDVNRKAGPNRTKKSLSVQHV